MGKKEQLDLWEDERLHKINPENETENNLGGYIAPIHYEDPLPETTEEEVGKELFDYEQLPSTDQNSYNKWQDTDYHPEDDNFESVYKVEGILNEEEMLKDLERQELEDEFFKACDKGELKKLDYFLNRYGREVPFLLGLTRLNTQNNSQGCKVMLNHSKHLGFSLKELLWLCNESVLLELLKLDIIN